MKPELLDLLWRDHPAAPKRGSRGPRPRLDTSSVVDTAIGIADRQGLTAVTVRVLAKELAVATMSIYTHVNSRDDLLVLMLDAARAKMPRPPFGATTWQERIRQVGRSNRDLVNAHPWLLDIHDDRSTFGPGTIAKYDYELHSLDDVGLDDVTRDAALTFLLDFVATNAAAARPSAWRDQIPELWDRWATRLGTYLGDDYPLAAQVGNAAGEAMDAPHSPSHAWEFGLASVINAIDVMASRPITQHPYTPRE